MRSTLLASLLFAFSASAAPKTVAVAYFDNNTGKADLDPLRKGLADMLITDLSNISAIQVVEREKLNQVLDELKLSKSKFIDPKTAQKLGKGLAAELILTGHYVVQGDQMRIDARVIQVATGGVAASETVEGSRDDFFSLEKDLVDLLVRTLDVKLGADEKRKLRTNPTQSFEAWSKYSAGLDAKDRGDDEKARALFEAALEADPGYKAAKSQMERLKVVVAAVTARQQDTRARLVEDIKKIDPKAKDYGSQVHSALIAIGHMPESVPFQLEVLTWFIEKDLRPVVVSGVVRIYPVALGITSVAHNYMVDPDTNELLPPVYEYVWKTYPDDSMLSGSNTRDAPTLLAQYINENKNPGTAEVRRDQYRSGFHKPYGDHRAAAHKFFKLIAKKLKR